MSAPDSLSLAVERLDAAVARLEAQWVAPAGPAVGDPAAVAQALAGLEQRLDRAIERVQHLLAEDA